MKKQPYYFFEKEKKMEKAFYEMTFICSNCGYTIVKKIEKGKLAQSHGECPHCGVQGEHNKSYSRTDKRQILLEGN